MVDSSGWRKVDAVVAGSTQTMEQSRGRKGSGRCREVGGQESCEDLMRGYGSEQTEGGAQGRVRPGRGGEEL